MTSCLTSWMKFLRLNYWGCSVCALLFEYRLRYLLGTGLLLFLIVFLVRMIYDLLLTSKLFSGLLSVLGLLAFRSSLVFSSLTISLSCLSLSISYCHFSLRKGNCWLSASVMSTRVRLRSSRWKSCLWMVQNCWKLRERPLVAEFLKSWLAMVTL